MKKLINCCIIVLLCILVKAYAQDRNPGGVSGTEAWFTTESHSFDPQGNYHWQDKSGDSTLLQIRSNNDTTEFLQSRNIIRTFNFNPAIYIYGGDSLKQANLTKNNLIQSTIIGVFAPKSQGDNRPLYSIHGRENDSIIISDRKVMYGNNQLEFTPNLSTSSENYNEETALKILTRFHAVQPKFSIWGEPRNSTITLGRIDSTSLDKEYFAKNTINSFNGYCPELLVYGRILTPFEKRRAESYLAMKYGISYDQSYFSSQGELLWDIDDNKNFNNRITAVIRDDASGLYQPLSTTSYEESPNLTCLNYNDSVDSYFDNKSINMPTSKRLIVMGREYANSMPDLSYMIWGDNDLSATMLDNKNILGRRWLLKTNLPSATEETPEWITNGVNVLHHNNMDYLVKDTTDIAYAITPQFEEDKGYISFRYFRNNGNVIIGFIENNENFNYAYCYIIATNGNIVRVQGAKTLDSIPDNTIVRLYKDKNKILLQYGNKGVDVMELPEDISLNHGIFAFPQSDNLYSIDEVRIGGAYDTGNQLELGLITEGHICHPDSNKIYLAIDRTGTGDFENDLTDYIKATGYDEERQKLIFNNIFWDTDGTGSDIFTFKSLGCIEAKIIPENDTSTGDSPNNDGKIDIEIKIGEPAFYFKLKQENVEVKEPQFFTKNMSITDLAPGEYLLEIHKHAGYNLFGIASDNGNNRYATNNVAFDNGTISWIHDNTIGNGEYIIGLGIGNVVEYGIRVKNNTAYKVDSSGETILYTIDRPRQVSLSYSSNDAKVRYNITESSDLITSGVTGNYKGIVQFISGHSEIYSLNIPLDDYLLTAPGVYSEYFGICDSISKDIIIEGVTEEPQQISEISSSIEQASLDNPYFRVYEDEMSNSFIAELYQDRPTPATLSIFDVAGRLVHTLEFRGSDNTRKETFDVPTIGVYIVKAITYDNEYTQKIISK